MHDYAVYIYYTTYYYYIMIVLYIFCTQTTISRWVC